MSSGGWMKGNVGSSQLVCLYLSFRVLCNSYDCLLTYLLASAIESLCRNVRNPRTGLYNSLAPFRPWPWSWYDSSHENLPLLIAHLARGTCVFLSSPHCPLRSKYCRLIHWKTPLGNIIDSKFGPVSRNLPEAVELLHRLQLGTTRLRSSENHHWVWSDYWGI